MLKLQQILPKKKKYDKIFISFTVKINAYFTGGRAMAENKKQGQSMLNGAFVFRLVYTIALRFDMPAFMLKFVSSVIVIAAISFPYLKERFPLFKRRFMQRFKRREA